MKSFFSIVSILVITGMVVGAFTKAAETASVTATVTARLISVTATDGEIAYGNVNLSGTASTTSSGVDDTQSANNVSNVSANINIIGIDTVGGTPWTLETTDRKSVV